MADDVDRATANAELALEAALQHRKPTLPSTGYCYYCSDDVHVGARFCSPECRDDYEREETLRARNGKD
jgi:hypothetical protein